MDACVFLMLWCVGAVDVSEDSMESSEEMVTPRAAASEADEEERKAATSEVPVEVVEAGEEVMVDALPPEAAAGAQEQQGKAEALVVVQEPEVKREELVAKVHPMHDPEPQGEEVLVVEAAAVSAVQEPEVKRDEVVVMETAAPPAVQESETKSGGVLVKDVVEVSRSLGAADTTEVLLFAIECYAIGPHVLKSRGLIWFIIFSLMIAGGPGTCSGCGCSRAAGNMVELLWGI
jgi:hypothetical protein